MLLKSVRPSTLLMTRSDLHPALWVPLYGLLNQVSNSLPHFGFLFFYTRPKGENRAHPVL